MPTRRWSAMIGAVRSTAAEERSDRLIIVTAAIVAIVMTAVVGVVGGPRGLVAIAAMAVVPAATIGLMRAMERHPWLPPWTAWCGAVVAHVVPATVLWMTT